MRLRDCPVPDGQVPDRRASGRTNSISFSNGILKSILFSKGILSGGGAPITNDDLCKAKITYIFSDGYATTSKLGSCPAMSLPLISSSWRPDPTVSPRKSSQMCSSRLCPAQHQPGRNRYGVCLFE